MKNKAILFLILTLITGLIGFTGLSFYGIIGVRVLFLIFADLLVISILSRVLFSEKKEMKLIRVKK